LAEGLSQLWRSNRMVHRNLKSENILLNSQGIPKIADFSLAIPAGEGVDATAYDGGLIMGTAYCLAPEQVTGSHTLTTQADMYALGILLYFLLTGIPPFASLPSVEQILSAQLTETVPPPHLLNPAVPVNLSWLLHRMLMKDPKDRYPDWDAFQIDVQMILSQQAPSCVRPDETQKSTIDITKMDSVAEPQKRIRIRTKPASALASYQGQSVEQEHTEEIKKGKLNVQIVLWCLLALGLGTLFDLRATAPGKKPRHLSKVLDPIGQSVAGLTDTLRDPAESDPETPGAPGTEEVKPVATDPTSGENQTAAAKEEPSDAAWSDEERSRLVHLLANGSLKEIDTFVRALPETRETRAEMTNFLARVPSPFKLASESLLKRVGKEIEFERDGKSRTVTLRAVAGGLIQLEFNGKSVEVPLNKLSADTLLQWTDKPETPEAAFAYCLLLMHSSKSKEIETHADTCPLFKDYLIHAATK
ncbi:MAG: protein kinase, partial [Kiritimatiellae bacterium]|nr:protein kinase [Kiritimatiellia bacterium]